MTVIFCDHFYHFNMGRKFCNYKFDDFDEFDQWAEPTKRYTFCHTHQKKPVKRIINDQSDDQGKLDLIRYYLLAISDKGIPIRRSICKPNCKRECVSKSGMSPTIDNLNTFLKLTDYESILWSICTYKIENNLTTYHNDEILEQFELQTEEFDNVSDTQEEIDQSYNSGLFLDYHEEPGMVHEIYDRHFINAIYDLVTWPDTI